MTKVRRGPRGGAGQLILGNVSDELIQVLCTALGGGAEVMNRSPPLHVPDHLPQRLCRPGNPPDSAFDLDTEAMLHQITVARPPWTFLAWPTTPRVTASARADRGDPPGLPGIVWWTGQFHFSAGPSWTGLSDTKPGHPAHPPKGGRPPFPHRPFGRPCGAGPANSTRCGSSTTSTASPRPPRLPNLDHEAHVPRAGRPGPALAGGLVRL